MIAKSFGEIPAAGALEQVDEAVLAAVRGGFDTVGGLLGRHRQRAAIAEAMRVVGEVNKYLTATEPYKMKDESQRERLGTVLHVAASACSTATRSWSPFLPHSANKVDRVLRRRGQFMPMPRIDHVEDLDPDSGAGLLVYPIITGDYSAHPALGAPPVTVGARLEKPTPIFTKLDPSVVDEELARLAATCLGWGHACRELASTDCRDVPAALRREAEAHDDGQPLRGLRGRRGGQPGRADGARRAEADGVQGAGHLLRRRGESRPVFGFKARQRSTSTRATTSPTRAARDRLLPQGLRRLAAALDIPHRGARLLGTGRERNRWSARCVASPSSTSSRSTSTSSTPRAAAASRSSGRCRSATATASRARPAGRLPGRGGRRGRPRRPDGALRSGRCASQSWGPDRSAGRSPRGSSSSATSYASAPATRRPPGRATTGPSCPASS